MVDDIKSRRENILALTVEELSIDQSMRLVKSLGPHTKLVLAQDMLRQARKLVSDYVDERIALKLPIKQED